MRWALAFLFLLLASGLGGYIFLKGYPYRLYSHWVEGKEWNRYYQLENYRRDYLAPKTLTEVPPYKEDYSQLWKEFPLLNAKIPLPVRHPLFKTIPILESTGEKRPPKIGMIFLSPEEREISRIHTLPDRLQQDFSQGQELFKLPFVRNRILQFSQEKLWKDIFSFQIEVKSKSLDEMIYDLYILHIRSTFFPKETLGYGLLSENKAIVELNSKDKDYIVELVITYDSGSIFSYILKTEKNNSESLKLRSKFLEEIKFGTVDSSLGKLLYTEFKQLNFARQVDQEGMLYLFSSFSQQLDNVELLKEMIFYLERGRNHSSQLRPLYTYALKQYGKTFTTRKILNELDDPGLELQRKIEIENIEKVQQAAKESNNPAPRPELTPEERMNLYLKKAKQETPFEKKDMIVH